MADAPLPWWVKPGLTVLVLMIFAGALAAIIKIGNDTQLTTMVQAIIGLVMLATGYFFGSSAGSDKQDDTLAGATAALATSAPVAHSAEATALENKLPLAQ